MNFAVYLFPLNFWYGCSRCRMLLSIFCKIFYFSRLSPVHYWFTFPWHRDWKQVKCWIIRVMKEKIRTFHQIYFSLWMENHARTKDVGNSLYHVMFIQLFLSCFVRWGVRTLPPMVFVSTSVRSYFGSDVSVWHVSKPREKCACWK